MHPHAPCQLVSRFFGQSANRFQQLEAGRWFGKALFVGVILSLMPQIATARDATIVSLRSGDGAHHHLNQDELSRVRTLRVVVAIPGQGKVTLAVTRSKGTPRTQHLFKGHLSAPSRSSARRTRGENRWAALSLLDTKKLTLNFAAPGSFGAVRYYALSGPELRVGQALRVVRAPHYALAGRRCHSEDSTAALYASSELHEGHSLQSLPVTARVNLARELAIRTVADYLWNNRYGSGSNSRIRTIANAASAIYRTDLGMEISVDSQKVDTNPSSYPEALTASEELLDLFRSSGERGTANVGVLFTGRNFDQGVIGIAYLGPVCIAPPFAYATVQRFQDALDPIVLAHELGHTLSAVHVADGIMTTALNPANPPRSFSSESIAQITSHVQQKGSCLATINSAPTPGATPTPKKTAEPKGNPGSPSTSGIRLGFQLDGSRVSLSIADDPLEAGCSFFLKAGTSGNALFSRGITLKTYAPGKLPNKLSAQLSRRTKKSARIYLRGYSLCEGEAPSRTNLKWFDAVDLPVGRLGTTGQVIGDLKRRLR